WPLPLHPVMWASVFIIDPLYTLWLLLACVAAFVLRERVAAQRALVAGLVLSSAYLGWSLAAKAMVERAAAPALAAMGLGDAPRFSVPTPFNTLLWRVVALTPEGYVEGLRSIPADRGPMRFEAHRSEVAALDALRGAPAVERLAWFNRGFMRAREVDGELVLSDLRMGHEPDYVFNFAVARRGAGWEPIPPRQVRLPRNAGPVRAATWRRMWGRDQAAADSGGATPADSASKSSRVSSSGARALSARLTTARKAAFSGRSLAYHPRCLRAIRTPAGSPWKACSASRCPSRMSRTSAGVGGGRRSPVARKCAISRKIHGRPWAARPTITASAPVRPSTSSALSGESMSPLATTGMRRRDFTSAMVSYSASPA